MEAGSIRNISSWMRELLDDLKGLFDRLGDFIDRSLLTQLRDLNVVRKLWQPLAPRDRRPQPPPAAYRPG
jgi:hypothetical protein